MLELGCGTGQATLPLAERGLRVVALDLSAEMARLARASLAAFPGVEVVTAAFEAWPLPAAPFDAVVAATSFHWIDPAVRLEKAWRALRPGGALGVITTHPVAGGSDGFFEEVQACYARVGPPFFAPLRLPTAGALPPGDAELASPGRLAAAGVRRRELELTYTAAEYLDLLRTYSDHRALGPARREALLAEIGRLIEERHGGRIRRRYLFELALARRPAR